MSAQYNTNIWAGVPIKIIHRSQWKGKKHQKILTPTASPPCPFSQQRTQYILHSHSFTAHQPPCQGNRTDDREAFQSKELMLLIPQSISCSLLFSLLSRSSFPREEGNRGSSTQPVMQTTKEAHSMAGSRGSYEKLLTGPSPFANWRIAFPPHQQKDFPMGKQPWPWGGLRVSSTHCPFPKEWFSLADLLVT